MCGGAGLALKQGGIGLCPLERKHISRRLPNFSGYVKATPCPNHILSPPQANSYIELPVWWPSQFDITKSSPGEVEVIATYREPGANFWIADLPWWIIKEEREISVWEKEYGINLNFSILEGEPLILYGKKGRGSYLLSYSHLESPVSPQANVWLDHIIGTLLGIQIKTPGPAPLLDIKKPRIRWEDVYLIRAWKTLLEVVARGEENLLLCWRLPWLLGWKRGVPGLALNSLLVLIVHLLETEPVPKKLSIWNSRKEDFKSLIDIFSREFLNYFRLHRRYYLKNPLRSPDHFAEDEISLQIKLICGGFPGDGGLFKKAGDLLEEIIYFPELC